LTLRAVTLRNIRRGNGTQLRSFIDAPLGLVADQVAAVEAALERATDRLG